MFITCRFSDTRSTKQTIYKYNWIKIMIIETVSGNKIGGKSSDRADSQEIQLRCMHLVPMRRIQKCDPRTVIRN